MIRRRVSGGILLLLFSLSAETVQASDEDAPIDRDSLVFDYGRTCENLGQLSRVELVGITHPTYGENFPVFCRPDSVYRCEDYNSLLVGLGRLEDNGRSSCRYLPDAP